MSGIGIYDVEFGKSKVKRIFCAVFGHNLYRGRGWYFIELGCHRCGLLFKYQWDLLDEQSDAAGDDSPKEKK